MSLDKLKAKLKSNTPDGVYAFFGDEEYTKLFYLKKLKDYAADGPAPDFNIALFNDETITAEALLDAIDAPPFMSPFKFIHVNGLPLSNKSLISDICEMCASVPEGVILVFSFRAGEIDYAAYTKKKEKTAYSPLLDVITQNGLCVEFCKESGQKLYSWISKHFASEGVTASRDAVEFLPVFCGNEMSVLHGEIEKLCAYCRGREVTPDDVKFVCCPNAEYQIYDLAGAVVEGNTAKTRSVMQSFRHTAIPPELIMATVAKNFCDMLYVKSAFAEKKNAADVKKTLAMQDWLYKRTLNSANRLDRQALKAIITACDNTDKALKGSAGDKYTQLELLFCEISMYGKARA